MFLIGDLALLGVDIREGDKEGDEEAALCPFILLPGSAKVPVLRSMRATDSGSSVSAAVYVSTAVLCLAYLEVFGCSCRIS